MSATARVKRALYQGAVGYTYQSEKLFYFEGKVTRAEMLEHVLPDVGAPKNCLSSRKPQEWRDQITLEHSGAPSASSWLRCGAASCGSRPNPHKDNADA